jgi:hypothetical protein
LVEGAQGLYEKKVRVPVALVSTPRWRPSWRIFCTFAVLMCPFGASKTAAQGQPVSAPSEPSWAIEILPNSRCAGDPEFAARLGAQIPQGQRAPLETAELRARVFVRADASAKISVFDQFSKREAGERDVSLPRGGCERAAEALALVVAVMIEAGRGSFMTETQEEPEEPPPEPPPPPPRKREPEPEKPRRAKPQRHAWLGPPPGHDLIATAGVGYGLLPDWSLALTAGWGMRWSSIWPIWLQVATGLSEPTPDPRVRIGVAYGLLAVCPLQLEKARFRAQLCPSLGVGAAWSEGRQVLAPARSTDPIALAGLHLGLHLRLAGPLELVAIARAEAPLVQLKFVYYRIDGSTPQVHETKPVVGTFLGGIGLRFR